MRSRSKVTTVVLALTGATVLGTTRDVLRAPRAVAPAPSTRAAASAPATPAAPAASTSPAPSSAAPAAHPPLDASEVDAPRESREGGGDGASRERRTAAAAGESSEGEAVRSRRTTGGRVRPRVQSMPTLVIGAPAERTSEW